MRDFRTCGCTGEFGCFICDVRGQRPRAKLPIRSATPEELTAQRESLGKNYKPGPRQATPFMPAPEDGKYRDSATRNAYENIMRRPLECTKCRRAIGPLYEVNADCAGWMCDECYEAVQKRLDAQPVEPPALPVPERTAEMEELMASLRAAAEIATAGKWRSVYLPGSKQRCAAVEAVGSHYIVLHVDRDKDYHPDTVEMWKRDCTHIAAASPENILKLLDHIEGKPELSIQEVQE